MITHVAVVPHPPLVVPELSPGPDAGLTELREACLDAVKRLGDRWTAVGAHTENVVLSDVAGSFRGYGADVRVRLAEEATESTLPLPALVAGWLRAQAGAGSVEMHLVAADTEPAECARIGKQLDDSGATGLLVLGDGSNRHGPRSPGSEDERAPGFDSDVAKALQTADAGALLEIDPALARSLGAGGRVPWQVLAGVGDGWRPELLYSEAPFGVGYHVAVWER
ncbi:hypothetical protein FPZ12_018765 [Amycolatopsis acidicola]|uniref:Extradiol ring-cleavage dioxygenase class III enzyme subunit B domain-containing protein n=1 Tax=Amycolatopsis acidicola TaxID=2596893 RepID=A0A5N0V490_9PSEU|nr:class III extradiol dioxygenase subunit B-like domain-containing protein [Amycolatopsis acidicola]KAA9159940.1 hypothetical protein FPZ12_018765 [Amycolatopsis acidicola]